MVGASDGAAVGDLDGTLLGAAVGDVLGVADGMAVGTSVGDSEGLADGCTVGWTVGLAEGEAVGDVVGTQVVAFTRWKPTRHSQVKPLVAPIGTQNVEATSHPCVPAEQ